MKETFASETRRTVADSTQQTVPIATVLVVAGSASLVEALLHAARSLAGVEVVTCSVRQAPTRAAELRPFALAMTDDVYAFDSAEFDALARDIRAELIAAESDALGAVRSTESVERALSRALERRRRRVDEL